MSETFAEILVAGGKSNSLGRSIEVIQTVLEDKTKLDELYGCVFDEDAWVRMRAIDAIEKIGRCHPEWLSPYIDKFQNDLSSNKQPSIQWHLAQIYSQVALSPQQKAKTISWIKHLLSTIEVDWIVATNSMKTLVQFTHDGSANTNDATLLLKIQQKHKSKSVVKRANKLLAELDNI